MAARTPWLIVGTVPNKDLPCLLGTYGLDGGNIVLESGERLDVQRGTPALLAAAALTLETLGHPLPQALLVGDTGSGAGSRLLYRFLSEALQEEGLCDLTGLTFHYLFPDVDWHNRLLLSLEALPKEPMLVADAGFMYAAKMSGYASRYTLFTPDSGELAFLADEKAPHPFYTRGFFLGEERDLQEQVRSAYASGNAAKWLIVKGRADHIICEGRCLEEVSHPMNPALEAIGGTGDLVTGVVSALLAASFPLARACSFACRISRLAGAFSRPTPATAISEILSFVPRAVKELLL